jgi:hypothetical protein
VTTPEVDEIAGLRAEVVRLGEVVRLLAEEVIKLSRGERGQFGPNCDHGILRRFCPPCRGDVP